MFSGSTMASTPLRNCPRDAAHRPRSARRRSPCGSRRSVVSTGLFVASAAGQRCHVALPDQELPPPPRRGRPRSCRSAPGSSRRRPALPARARRSPALGLGDPLASGLSATTRGRGLGDRRLAASTVASSPNPLTITARPPTTSATRTASRAGLRFTRGILPQGPTCARGPTAGPRAGRRRGAVASHRGHGAAAGPASGRTSSASGMFQQRGPATGGSGWPRTRTARGSPAPSGRRASSSRARSRATLASVRRAGPGPWGGGLHR